MKRTAPISYNLSLAHKVHGNQHSAASWLQEGRNAEHMFSQTASAARQASGDAMGILRQGAQRTSNPNRGGDSGITGSHMLQKRSPPEGQQQQASYNVYTGSQHHNSGNSSYGPPSPGSNYTSWSTTMPAELASLGLLPLPLAPSSEAHAGAAVALRGGPSLVSHYFRHSVLHRTHSWDPVYLASNLIIVSLWP